jgi:aldehyde dehydrogenase (NAD+)
MASDVKPATPTPTASWANPFQALFDAQRERFASGATRSYEWRIDQLDRMGRMVGDHELTLQEAMKRDFKTASSELYFETMAEVQEVVFQKSQLKSWMAPVEAPVPRALAATGHKGFVYRDPYRVALIIGPSNGPLLLLIRPALTALAAGNTCVLSISEALPATGEVLLELVREYTSIPGM